jgi:hypothetical protein
MHPVTPAVVLAGRVDKLALLDGPISDLPRGHGNAGLIWVEPGIGKTALVHEAAAHGFDAPQRRAPRISGGRPDPTSVPPFPGHPNVPASSGHVSPIIC